ncbi:hypothetical protein HDV57DRAFT_493973 [Trichoderma longibrachiatum]|uniref:Uncharacterized protein n=1 Tax=Trichoderma longibrachiatum ATCC 18648 TaxID=983965 RepID=A0A2T4CGI1_TRILO|nr:hypothetical protein M440DRAFT_1398018 [Trichoderma longibrachiatum ATCC 18648]
MAFPFSHALIVGLAHLFMATCRIRCSNWKHGSCCLLRVPQVFVVILLCFKSVRAARCTVFVYV